MTVKTTIMASWPGRAPGIQGTGREPTSLNLPLETIGNREEDFCRLPDRQTARLTTHEVSLLAFLGVPFLHRPRCCANQMGGRSGVDHRCWCHV